MPKSSKILRRRPPSGDRKNLGKRMQNYLESLPSRSRGFAGSGWSVGAAGPKVGVLPSEQTAPKGPKGSRQKQNGVIMTRFLKNRFEPRKSIENCSVWWFSLRCVLLVAGTVLLFDFIVGSVLLCLRRKTAHV